MRALTVGCLLFLLAAVAAGAPVMRVWITLDAPEGAFKAEALTNALAPLKQGLEIKPGTLSRLGEYELRIEVYVVKADEGSDWRCATRWALRKWHRSRFSSAVLFVTQVEVGTYPLAKVEEALVAHFGVAAEALVQEVLLYEEWLLKERQRWLRETSAVPPARSSS